MELCLQNKKGQARPTSEKIKQGDGVRDPDEIPRCLRVFQTSDRLVKLGQPPCTIRENASGLFAAVIAARDEAQL